MTARPSTHHQEVASVARASQPQGRLRHRLHHTPGGGGPSRSSKGTKLPSVPARARRNHVSRVQNAEQRRRLGGEPCKYMVSPRCKNDEDAYLTRAPSFVRRCRLFRRVNVFRRGARAPESCDPRPPLPLSPPMSAQPSLDKLCDQTPHAHTNGFWACSAKSAANACGKLLHRPDGASTRAHRLPLGGQRTCGPSCPAAKARRTQTQDVCGREPCSRELRSQRICS